MEFLEKLGAIEASVHRLAGRPFNLGSTKQLSDVLFEELKLPVVKRTKTGYSTDSEVLERLAPKHEIAQLLLEHRKLSKLISTYTNVLSEAVMPSTGRVHADFQQTASQTGRLISTEPDLQRTPIRTPEGKRIRKAFIAPDGYRLISADWSQIELRILAHFSRDERLVESYRGAIDVHRRTAGQLFHKLSTEVSPEERNIGKTVNFATIYGQGASALGQILGLPRKEAQAYIDSYFDYYRAFGRGSRPLSKRPCPAASSARCSDAVERSRSYSATRWWSAKLASGSRGTRRSKARRRTCASEPWSSFIAIFENEDWMPISSCRFMTSSSSKHVTSRRWRCPTS
ncbi:MAG: hypothetical protein HC923_09770 [Myxococcales bacterium]|nr:hypothetical protein [Myxococcales bacterium]